MHNENNYITMLGTGNALATRCYPSVGLHLDNAYGTPVQLFP